MSPRPRRWHPGKGYRCIRDSGSVAIWMRLEPDLTVSVVVYLDGYGPNRDGIWTVNAAPSGPILYAVIDKPHRVTWAFAERIDDYYGTPVTFQPLPKTKSPRRGPKNRTWRRTQRMRKPWPRSRGKEAHSRHGEWLPRPFREQVSRG